MHRHGSVPPNVRTTSALPAKRVRIAPEAVRTDVRRSVAVAAGFGGPVAAISLVSA